MLKVVKLMTLCVIVLTAAFPVIAGTSGQWTISMESSGQDVNWESTANVRPGYENYYYDCQFTQVEVLLDMADPQDDVWGDYSPAFSPDNAGLNEGVEVEEVLNEVYDANELSFNFVVSIDEKGFASASLTDVQFNDPWVGYDIIGLKVVCSLTSTAVQQIWGDDFNSYTTAQKLGDVDGWMTPGWEDTINDLRRCEVGSTNGKAWMVDGYYGGYLDEWQYEIKPAIADSNDAIQFDGATVTDYIVRVEASKNIIASGYGANSYVLSRANSTDYIYLKSGLSGTGDIYKAGIADTVGGGIYDIDNPTDIALYDFAEVDENKPIYLTLKVEGTSVTGIAEHNGGKKVLRYDTTIASGMPGFGAEWQWGYMDGLFDNFEVYAIGALDPSVCGDDGTYYLKGDINKNCKVDIEDFKEMAENWLSVAQ